MQIEFGKLKYRNFELLRKQSELSISIVQTLTGILQLLPEPLALILRNFTKINKKIKTKPIPIPGRRNCGIQYGLIISAATGYFPMIYIAQKPLEIFFLWPVKVSSEIEK